MKIKERQKSGVSRQ